MGTGGDYNRRTLAGKVRVSSANLLLIPILVLLAGCSHRYDLKNADVQDNFGVQMAKQNLWREAMFRFRRAVEIDPSDAMAHNNLAVAYEANGDFENARKEYLEALKLDRANQYIQKNYSRYVEFLSRNRKRQTKDAKDAKEVKTAADTPATTPTATPASNPQPQPPVQPPAPPESLR